MPDRIDIVEESIMTVIAIAPFAAFFIWGIWLIFKPVQEVDLLPRAGEEK